MTSPKRAPSDTLRAAKFRETGRSILRKDRDIRKFGLTTDTAKAIAQALERAYQEGHAAALSPADKIISKPKHEAIDWILIPPRPRSAFWTCCLFTYGDNTTGLRERQSWLQSIETITGRNKWRFTTAEPNPLVSQFGNTTIQPLIRLGLLEEQTKPFPRLVISKKGRETWMKYLAAGNMFPDDIKQSSKNT